MKTLHIINPDLLAYYQAHLLGQEDILFNVEIKSYDQAFYPQLDSIRRLIQARKILVDHQQDLPKHLAFVCDDIPSIQSILSFIDQADQNQVDLNTLPAMDQSLLVTCLLDNGLFRPFRFFQPLNKDIQVIVHPFYQAFHQQKIKPTLIPYGPSHLLFKEGLNRRHEVEGALALLKDNPNQKVLILMGSLDYQIELDNFLSLNQIPYNNLVRKTTNPVALIFNQGLKAHDNKDSVALINYLRAPFWSQSSHLLAQWIEDHKLSYDQAMSLDKDLGENQIKPDLLEALTLHRQGQESLEALFDLFASTLGATSDLLDLKSTLESIDTQDRILLSYLLQKPQSAPLFPEGAKVTLADLTFQALERYDLIIALGMVEDNVFGFSRAQGLFNEIYLKEVKGFPSLKDRMDFHNQQIKHFIHQADQVILSYPQMGYLDSAGEKSLWVSQLMDQEQAQADFWPSQTYPTWQARFEAIPCDLSRNLFLSNGSLNLSASAIKTFFSSSFHYFIRYGLKIKDQDDNPLSSSQLGSLAHRFFAGQIDNISDYFDALKPLFPNDHMLLNAQAYTLETNLQDFLNSTGFLKEEGYQIIDTEKGFDQLQAFLDLDLTLVGSIDRIDQGQKGLKVYDYKSSAKNFQRKQFLLGQDVQLPLYLLTLNILSKDNTIFGAYYLPFSPDRSSYSPYKYSKREGLKPNDPTSDTRKLQGITIDLDPSTPTFNSQISGVRVKKDLSITGLSNFTELQNYLYFLLDFLHHSLASGKISIFKEDHWASTWDDHSLYRAFYPDPNPLDPLASQAKDSFPSPSELKQFIQDFFQQEKNR